MYAENGYVQFMSIQLTSFGQAENQIPDDNLTNSIAEMFKIFGDNTRIRILWTLFDKELCVYDIAKSLGMSQSAISHQLKTLKQGRLIKSRRDGKKCFLFNRR